MEIWIGGIHAEQVFHSINQVKMTEKWGEIHGKLDLVRVIGVLLYLYMCS